MKKYFKILPYLFLVSSVVLVVLYRLQLVSNPAYQTIDIFGQRISTDTTAIIFGIIFIILFVACSSFQKVKLFLVTIVISGIVGYLLAIGISYGKYGEANLIRFFLPILYLIIAVIASLTTISLRLVRNNSRAL